MSCEPKFNCWPDKSIDQPLVLDRSRCTHQQMKLKPGFCYRDGEPLMVCEKDPAKVQPWAAGNKLIGIIQCGENLISSELECCPRMAWCAGCFNVAAIAWPVAPLGEGQEELQQQINDEIDAMMGPDPDNISSNIKLQRMHPSEC